MPTAFFCSSCKLGFAVGWFHYHGEADGFDAETLLVCSACGTMNTVQHPASVRPPVLGGLLLKRKAVPKRADRLMAQSGPCFVENAKNDVTLHLKPWQECGVTHVLCPKSKQSYMKGFIDLGPIKCHHCRRTETIVRDWEYHNVRCPACGQPSLSVAKQWIT